MKVQSKFFLLSTAFLLATISSAMAGGPGVTQGSVAQGTVVNTTVSHTADGEQITGYTLRTDTGKLVTRYYDNQGRIVALGKKAQRQQDKADKKFAKAQKKIDKGNARVDRANDFNRQANVYRNENSRIAASLGGNAVTTTRTHSSNSSNSQSGHQLPEGRGVAGQVLINGQLYNESDFEVVSTVGVTQGTPAQGSNGKPNDGGNFPNDGDCTGQPNCGTVTPPVIEQPVVVSPPVIGNPNDKPPVGRPREKDPKDSKDGKDGNGKIGKGEKDVYTQPIIATLPPKVGKSDGKSPVGRPKEKPVKVAEKEKEKTDETPLPVGPLDEVVLHTDPLKADPLKVETAPAAQPEVLATSPQLKADEDRVSGKIKIEDSYKPQTATGFGKKVKLRIKIKAKNVTVSSWNKLLNEASEEQTKFTADKVANTSRKTILADTDAPVDSSVSNIAPTQASSAGN